MSKTIRFYEKGDPSVLRYDELPPRPLSDGEIRLKVEAIGLNRAEIMYRSGDYVEEALFPSRLGYEAAGTIVEVGPGVQDLRVGDRVAAIPSFSMNEYGTYGESIVLPAAAMVAIPENVSSQEAAAAWMQYLTAYLIIAFGKMKAGQAVLITAASSSVGLAAIQFANALGARPIATTRNSAKVQELLNAGAAAVIDTSTTPLAGEVMRLTNGKGADIIFDPVVGDLLPELCRAAADGAELILYGALGGNTTTFPVLDALWKSLTMRVYRMANLSPDQMEEAKLWISEGMRTRRFIPRIAKTFAFEEMVEAHRFLESNEQVGKIVVTVT
jgi:NADPH:quinone reductase-like Zn-dependent oxidoreductase